MTALAHVPYAFVAPANSAGGSYTLSDDANVDSGTYDVELRCSATGDLAFETATLTVTARAQ